MVENVDSFYYFAGVLFEQKDEKLVLTRFEDIYQLLSLFSVELTWEAHVSYGIYHQFLI